MTKFELKKGIWTLAFNGVEYQEGQIFDLPEKALKEIEEHIIREDDKPVLKEEEIETEPVNFDDLPPTIPQEEIETPIIEETKEEIEEEVEEEGEIVLDFPALEKMTRENLFKFVKEDLKNAWVEVEGVKFNSTKQEIIDILKKL